MGDKTGIQWTDATWNPTTGCDRVSPGCDSCYALTQAKRLKAMGQAKYQRDGDPRTSGPGFGLSVHQDVVYQPLRWHRPRRIFVNSMSDLFHDEVPDGFIAQVWDVMGQAQQHTFQILTKRHARMRSWARRWADQSGDGDHDKPSGMPPLARGPEAVRAAYRSGRARLFADMLERMGTPPEGAAYPLYDWMEGQRFWESPLRNVWLGVSAEDQHWADIRIPALLDTPAQVPFVSAEPLLGPITFRWARWHDWRGSNHLDGLRKLGWVIVGGESGPRARPMDVGWVREIVAQCKEAGVPVFVKQLGSVWARDHGADSHGGNWDFWPEDLRVRESPDMWEWMFR